MNASGTQETRLCFNFTCSPMLRLREVAQYSFCIVRHIFYLSYENSEFEICKEHLWKVCVSWDGLHLSSLVTIYLQLYLRIHHEKVPRKKRGVLMEWDTSTSGLC